MRALPDGLVTFVFTDIESSTRLFQRAGDAYPGLLTEHRRLLREAFTANDGVELGTEGDSFFVAFDGARAALAACLDGQLALGAHPWPEGLAVRVRMGVHSGEAHPIGEGYVSLVVHQAARVAASGHGGQVVLSGATFEAARHELPPGCHLEPLGRYALKDFDVPEQLFQLAHAGLAAGLPALRAVPAAAHDLPQHRTSFIGRDREMQELRLALTTGRLVTVTGPGGVGKTRLVVEAARASARDRVDGARFVDLQRATSGPAVVSAFATALGVREEPGRPLQDSLADGLRDGTLLIVVDCCEHVLADAASVVDTILSSAPAVTVLATSREPLAVEGELVWALAPMEPGDAQQLFASRAASARREFAVDAGTVGTVGSICEAVDRLPLAIELAAARVSALSPGQILSRLSDRLALLTKRTGAAVERHRTLRATIEWSYALLDPGQQAVLSGLSVFRGGCTAEAAEAVVGADLDQLQSLVEKSLVSASQDRFALLQTIREFAAELLSADEARAADLHRLHAEHFSAVAPEIGRRARSSEPTGLQALEADDQNMNAAFSWAVDNGRVDLCELLVGGLWYGWVRRGSVVDGYRRAETAVALSTTPSHSLLTLAAELARFSGALERSVELKQAAITLGGDPGEVAADHTDLAEGLVELGRFEEAEDHARLGLALRTRIGVDYGIAHAQAPLVQLALARGEHEQASARAEEAALTFRSLGYRSDLAWACVRGATARMRLDELAQAGSQLIEAIREGREIGETAVLVVAVERAAELAARRGDVELALALYGAARAGRARSGYVFESDDGALRLALQELDEGRCLALVTAGEAMSLDDALTMVQRDIA